MTDAFCGYHPSVNFLYFAAAIGFSMFFMHPVCLLISLICAFCYSLYLHGKKALSISIKFMLPMLIFTALLNPLFNHSGATILAYLPDGNPLTLESLLHGIAAALMLISVIGWFSCFNKVITDDKFVYLFGRLMPSLSLMLSIALRFIPRFRKQVSIISNAQKSLGFSVSEGSIIQKLKVGIRIMSIMLTWILENVVETADSMKCRGYGLKGRTAFSIFKFYKRDMYALLYILACGGLIFAGTLGGGLTFRYFPTITGQWNSALSISLYLLYFALLALPLIVNLKEALIWKHIASKT